VPTSEKGERENYAGYFQPSMVPDALQGQRLILLTTQPPFCQQEGPMYLHMLPLNINLSLSRNVIYFHK